MSDDASRNYGSCSSSLLGGQLQAELIDRLEIQQQTSTTTRYQQQVVTDALRDLDRCHTCDFIARDFVAQLYRARKFQYATVHVARCDFVT